MRKTNQKHQTPQSISYLLKYYNSLSDSEKEKDLVIKHIPYLVKSIKRYSKLHEQIEDIFCCGLLAYVEAVKKFDSTRGNFMHFSDFFLKKHVREFLKTDVLDLTLPSNVHSYIVKCISDFLTLTEEDFNDPVIVNAIFEKHNIPQNMRETILDIIYKHVNRISIDYKYIDSSDKDLTLHDVITDNNKTENYNSIELKVDIENALNKLTDIEQTIVIMKFGLDGKNERTLKEIGDEIGKSHEYVRLTLKKALDKLKKYLSEN